MTSKSGKKLFVIGLLIIVAAIVYFFIINPNASPFGFGFGSQLSNYAIPITFRSGPIIEQNCIGQIPGQPGKLVPASAGSSSPNITPVVWASGATTVANAPSVNTSSGSNKINITAFTTNTGANSPNILWLFPTKSGSTLISPGLSTSNVQMFDTFIWPVGINLSIDEAKTFNWYMNQDSINTYMSDIDLDIDYDNPTGGDDDNKINPPMPANGKKPSMWGREAGSSGTDPFIKQSIGRALYGIQHNVGAAAGTDNQTAAGGGAGTATGPNGASGTYNASQIARTNNFVTVIADYTNLYSYICGYSNLSDSTKTGYGLANITVATTGSLITDSYYYKNNIKIGTETTPGNWMGKEGAFNDCAFYEDGLNGEKKQSEFKLNGNVKHAIWSVLLARQNQLIGRLEPKIVATL